MLAYGPVASWPPQSTVTYETAHEGEVTPHSGRVKSRGYSVKQKNEKKKKALLTPHFGCQSVLEAKIEIPDTPVVNIAHASPTLEQALL